MKNNWLIGVLLCSTVAFGQKKNETDAALAYKNKFLPALSSQDFDGAKKAILSAKEFIDLAAAHPETKESSKTMYYKGEIYLGLMTLSQMKEDADLKPFANEGTMNEALASLKKAYADKKFKSDIDNAVYRARVFFDQSANALYNKNEYKTAYEMYTWQAKFAAVVGELDSNAVFYSAVCAEKAEMFTEAANAYYDMAKTGYRGAISYNLAAGAYRKSGDGNKAKEVINEGRKQYPTDRDLLLELVNINIDANDPTAAEEALNQAIATDPNNKQLHYTIGTIYIELAQNEKAEAALMKALEIDPDYTDAQYQLGAFLVTWASDLKTKASQLNFGDAQYDVLNAKSDDIYKRAVKPLEDYITKEPNDKAVLTSLFQLHRALGNSEKAIAYKKRADAL